MKSTVAKENSGRTLFLKKQASPDNLELVWDNWRSRPEDDSVTLNGMSSSNTTALASSSYENAPATPLSSAKSAKRWGMFGSKKTAPNTHTITASPPHSEEPIQRELARKKSRVLKKARSMCKSKSSADLKSRTLGQNDLSTVNCAPLIPGVPATPIEYSYVPPSPSFPKDNLSSMQSGDVLYFTVDPAWDESKGEAHLYFLPSPGVVVARDDKLRQNATKATKTPHDVTTTATHSAKSPRSIKSVVKSDNQTSFLFIE